MLFRLATTAFLFLALASANAFAGECDPGDPPGTKCRAVLKNLHPTQGAVGMDEVDFHKKEVESFKSEEELVEWMKSKRGRAVRGPGGELYLIDGHHHTSAYLKAGLKYSYVTIEADLSNLSEAEFWKELEKRDWANLKDANGKTISYKQLPKFLKDLDDDPYRYLAWLVMKSGAFEDSGIPFSEFKWADYFREHFTKEEIKNASKETVEKAAKLAFEAAAAKLPGFRKINAKALVDAVAGCMAGYKKLMKKFDID